MGHGPNTRYRRSSSSPSAGPPGSAPGGVLAAPGHCSGGKADWRGDRRSAGGGYSNGSARLLCPRPGRQPSRSVPGPPHRGGAGALGGTCGIPRGVPPDVDRPPRGCSGCYRPPEELQSFLCHDHGVSDKETSDVRSFFTYLVKNQTPWRTSTPSFSARPAAIREIFTCGLGGLRRSSAAAPGKFPDRGPIMRCPAMG